MKVYLAGPMRGYPFYNFPAFDAAAEHIRAANCEVVSPAEMDRKVGFDPAKDEASPEFVQEAMRRDLKAIIDCDAVAVLPGWEHSQGARREVELARFLNIPILSAATLEPLPDETVLQEADRLVSGDRGSVYGHPYDDFSRTARIWEGILGCTVTAAQVGLCMIGVKISREVHKPKRDNLVDIAGYAKTVALVRERETQLAAEPYA